MADYKYLDDGGLIIRINLSDVTGITSVPHIYYAIDVINDDESDWKLYTFDSPIDNTNDNLELKIPKSDLRQDTNPRGYNCLIIYNEYSNPNFGASVLYVCDKNSSIPNVSDGIVDLRCGGWHYYNSNLHHPTATIRTDL